MSDADQEIQRLRSLVQQMQQQVEQKDILLKQKDDLVEDERQARLTAEEACLTAEEQVNHHKDMLELHRDLIENERSCRMTAEVLHIEAYEQLVALEHEMILQREHKRAAQTQAMIAENKASNIERVRDDLQRSLDIALEKVETAVREADHAEKTLEEAHKRVAKLTNLVDFDRSKEDQHRQQVASLKQVRDEAMQAKNKAEQEANDFRVLLEKQSNKVSSLEDFVLTLKVQVSMLPGSMYRPPSMEQHVKTTIKHLYVKGMNVDARMTIVIRRLYMARRMISSTVQAHLWLALLWEFDFEEFAQWRIQVLHVESLGYARPHDRFE